jgi:hypothetical protein
MQRRIVGLDLGVATDHTAVVLDESGAELARRRVQPTRASFEALRAAALSGAEEATVLEVVMEPTGPAWLPVAVFFGAAGDRVYRVSSQRASDLRRYFRRHHKTNRIDATTLARMAIVEGDALRPVELARGDAAALDREVRVTERLTEEIATRKVRIRDLARQLMPTSATALSKQLSRADLEVLRTWGNPKALVAAGVEAVDELVQSIGRGMHGRAKAEAFVAAATEALALYGDSDAVPFEALAADLRRPGPRMSAAARSSTGGSTPRAWPGRCRASATRADRWPWPWSAGPGASPTPMPSAPTPAWCPRRRRPARPTTRARP